MICITEISDQMILFSTLKHFKKHFAHGKVYAAVSVTRADADW